jgi:hypothetical protein
MRPIGAFCLLGRLRDARGAAGGEDRLDLGQRRVVAARAQLGALELAEAALGHQPDEVELLVEPVLGDLVGRPQLLGVGALGAVRCHRMPRLARPRV